MSGTRYLARLEDRSLFPELEPRAYLNHAAVSPASVAVQAATAEVVADYARKGLEAIHRWIPQRALLKDKLGRLIGTTGDNLALTPSTSFSVLSVALCFPWEPGDRVLVFEGEFPANVTAWQQAARLHGLEVDRIPLTTFARHPDEGIAALAEALRREPRLVATSAVQFQTGLSMPLAAMAEACHAAGAELFVDGIQAVGITPIDVDALGVDYFAGGAHKWLMGLEGVGYLYARPERAAKLRPHVAGWLSHEDPVSFLVEGPGHLDYSRRVRSSIDFLEIGSTNAVGCYALEAAIDLIEQIGTPTILAHVQAYHDALEEGLEDRGFRSLRSPLASSRSGSLSVLPPAGVDVIKLNRALASRGVSASTPDGRLRFSPHWPNAIDEVGLVLEAVDAAVRAV
ncbi:MAG: aminotransferase class V-fold PLP-dependent enzyme [Deltaproteobacteria bacterium]|nr:aminotransferase class V-fold PLP-dependent enzyme [Deltaproteobacteria bacterium]